MQVAAVTEEGNGRGEGGGEDRSGALGDGPLHPLLEVLPPEEQGGLLPRVGEHEDVVRPDAKHDEQPEQVQEMEVPAPAE